MALSYSLKYKKLNFFQKVLLEKEGEIVIDRNFFRLKGKGAHDQGEMIYFSEMKDIFIKEQYLLFTTFSKESYILSGFANLFDSFLKDFWRVRNEYLADNLFMKIGMLYQEYESYAEIINIHGKIISKGKSRLQFYEGSVVVFPEMREVFAIYYNFLKKHEFDEDEYVLRFYLENGNIVNISKLGTYLEDAKELLESLLGKMYERIIRSLQEVLPQFDSATLLKLGYRLKDGRTVSRSALKKIDGQLPAELEKITFGDDVSLQEKIKIFSKTAKEENFYFGCSFSQNPSTKHLLLHTWICCALPEKNILAFSMRSGHNENSLHFFRIIIQQGQAQEKLAAKILEIDQSLFLFRFDLRPVSKDRRELKQTKYRAALKKLSFLHMLRKSYLGKSVSKNTDEFAEELEKFYKKSAISSQHDSVQKTSPVVTEIHR